MKKLILLFGLAILCSCGGGDTSFQAEINASNFSEENVITSEIIEDESSDVEESNSNSSVELGWH